MQILQCEYPYNKYCYNEIAYYIPLKKNVKYFLYIAKEVFNFYKVIENIYLIFFNNKSYILLYIYIIFFIDNNNKISYIIIIKPIGI